MDIDRDIHAIIRNPATSYWLSDALRAALKRDPIDAAHDAEQLDPTRPGTDGECLGLDGGAAGGFGGVTFEVSASPKAIRWNEGLSVLPKFVPWLLRLI